MKIKLHAFLILFLIGDEWSASRYSHFTPREEPRNLSDRRLKGSQNRSGRDGQVSAVREFPKP